MSEEFAVVEMGDSGQETKQLSPGGPHWDSLYGFGWAGGLADQGISDRGEN
jgi:hypothetical protein